MVSISFTQLRQNAKTYFDKVEKGKTIRVIRHGKVIAEITPPKNKQSHFLKPIVPLVIPGVSLSKTILKERKFSPLS